MNNISIPNVIITPIIHNGTLRGYDLAPINGYVLHDNAGDYEEVDMFTQEPTGRIIFTYSVGSCSCGANYDFSTVTVTDENGVNHTAYGSREFFARPRTEVPENQIYSGSNNTREIV